MLDHLSNQSSEVNPAIFQNLGKKTKCGFIAIAGLPNAGKSTLLNALVGQKVAGVSQKPQTTRNKITGICMHNDVQMLVLDTPGLHRTDKFGQLNAAMQTEAWQGIADAEVVLYLIDVRRGITEDDCNFLAEICKRTQAPLWLIGSKNDMIAAEIRTDKCDAFLLAAGELARHEEFDHGARVNRIVTMTSRSPKDVERLKRNMAEMMPEGPWLYDPEQTTDRSARFVACEMIREQAFRLMNQEIPYGLTVVIHKLEVGATLTKIMADIVVTKETHKSMVIGAKGAQIKQIGSNARPNIEKLFGTKVFLQLNVKVQSGWEENMQAIADLAEITLQ